MSLPQPATAKFQEINVDSGTFLAVEGQGEPGGEVFQDCIEYLYARAYTLKFTLKRAGVLDFKVGKLECLYLSELDKTPRKEWRWRLLLRVPEGVTPQHLAQAKKSLKERKGLDAAGRARETQDHGPVARGERVRSCFKTEARHRARMPILRSFCYAKA